MTLTRRVEQVADAVAMVACVWFACTALWGINAQPHVGHIGSAGAAIALTAENSLRWHSIYPLYDWFAKTNPYPQSAYCHHPFGFVWTSEIFVYLFDHRDFVCNLPSALMSVMTAPLLYKTCKQAWGPIAGASGVVGFVGLPITVGFSIFHNLEVMTIFGVVLFFFGHVRYQATGRSLHLALSLLGAFVAACGDWAGYMIMAPFLGWALLRRYILPSWMTPVLRWRRYDKWWALSVAIAVGTAVLWVALFKRADKLSEWITTAESRGGGAEQTLSKVLESRTTWIDFSFTPWAIWVGKLAAFVAVARWIVRREDDEVISLALLAGATVQYLMFKQGADVHIFWPQYFGAYFGYAVAQLVATGRDVATLVASRISLARAEVLGVAVAGVLALATTVPELPDGVRSLKVWRQTGGKYDDKGTLFRSQADLLYVIKKVLRPQAAAGKTIGASSTSAWGWEHDWALDAAHDGEETPSPAHGLWIARVSGLGSDRLKELAAKSHVRIYGDTAVVTSAEGPGPLDAFAESEREPNVLEWFFTNNNEPVRSLSDAPDPFATWEWRTHLGQPAEAPHQEPTTLDEIRIAHNAAVDSGNTAEAERLLDHIRTSIDRTREAHFANGHELIGVRVTHGVRPMIEVYFQAGGSTPQDTTFVIRSDIVRKAHFSTIPVSPVECDHAYPPPMPTKLWRAGFVYRFVAALNHRIGVERYWGTWAGGPARTHGDPRIELYEE